MSEAIDNHGLTPRLRAALAEDIGLVRAILSTAANDLTTRFGEGHWSGVRSVETLRKYAGEGVLYVVEQAATVVGTLRLTDRKIGFYRSSWFVDPQAAAGYLMDMAIDPAHQRRGIGRQAMIMAENLARSQDLPAIRLDAYGGPAGAGRFYQKCGYRLVHQGEMNGVALEYYEKLVEPR
jgi:GNAT superfamily N-acetyltransferase